MDTDLVTFIIIILLIALYLYSSNRSRNLNRNNQCAKCEVHLEEKEVVLFKVPHHTYLYCTNCGGGVLNRDRVFIYVSIVLTISILLFIAYLSS